LAATSNLIEEVRSFPWRRVRRLLKQVRDFERMTPEEGLDLMRAIMALMKSISVLVVVEIIVASLILGNLLQVVESF